MIYFACVQCDRRHKVHESMTGATVKCPCGQLMLVPEPVAVPEVAMPVYDDKLSLTCICGKTLRVPNTAIGKSVRCSCGETLAVAGSEEEMLAQEMAEPTSPGGSVLGGGDIGLFASQPAVPATPTYNAAPSYNPTAPYHSSPPQNQNPYGVSYTHDYLKNAHAENEAQRESNQFEYSSELNTARWTLIVVGVLTLLVNFVLLIAANSEVATIAQDQASKGVFVDQRFLVLVVRVVYAFAMFVGIIFMILGSFVYRFPVLAPSIGLALYVTINVIYLCLNPMAFASPIGIIIRLAIIGTLIKAINSGIYYRR